MPPDSTEPMPPASPIPAGGRSSLPPARSAGCGAAPAGIGDSAYRSIGEAGENVFDFADWSRGRGLESFSVYWGSVDSDNFIDFLDAGGHRVAGFGGGALPVANGNQAAAATNRRVFFDFRPEQKITAVRFRSEGAAFEFDSLAASAMVPEPENWALLIIGFGLVGVLARRRRQRAIVAG